MLSLRNAFLVFGVLSSLSVSALARDKKEVVAAPAGCSFQIRHKIIGEKNKKHIHTIAGAMNGFCSLMEGCRKDLYMEKPFWYKSKTEELENACQRYLSEQFGKVDDGYAQSSDYVYHCEPVYIEEAEDANRLYVDVVRAEPVFERLTLQDIAARKCERLADCMLKANTPGEIQWIQNMAVDWSCQ